MEREFVNALDEHEFPGVGRERERERERAERESRERASLFLWDYTSLGLGWTKGFFKMTKQFPQLLQVLDASTPSS